MIRGVARGIACTSAGDGDAGHGPAIGIEVSLEEVLVGAGIDQIVPGRPRVAGAVGQGVPLVASLPPTKISLVLLGIICRNSG